MGYTITTEHAIVLQNVQHTAHLTEDEDARSLLLHAFQKLVENDHLASVVNEMFSGGVRWTRFLQASQYMRGSEG